MKRSPLKKMGKDKARETAKYWPLRRKFIEDHPFCEFPITPNDKSVFTPSCMSGTSSIHHKMGQNWRVMNDTRYWIGVCIEHHAWIEDNKREARKRGLILYK
jgi:hypothetical protein